MSTDEKLMFDETGEIINSLAPVPKVYQSNAVVRSSYRLSIRELKLVLCACAKLKPDSKVEDCISVKASDMIKMGYDRRNVYRELKEAADDLFEKKIVMNPNENKEIKVRWLQGSIYDKEKCEAKLMFSSVIFPYLTQLQEQYTVIELNDVVGLRTFHAIRMYHMLSSFRSTGWWKVSVKELRSLLGVADGEYERFSHFHSRIVKESIKQINENPNSKLLVEINQRKEGKQTIGYSFEIKEKDLDKSAETTSPRIIKLNKVQAKRYAAKLMFSPEWHVYYETILRPNGLDLNRPFRNKDEEIEALQHWLVVKENATKVEALLEEVGYRPRKR